MKKHKIEIKRWAFILPSALKNDFLVCAPIGIGSGASKALFRNKLDALSSVKWSRRDEQFLTELGYELCRVTISWEE
jgi:hypothetical protein